MTGSCLGDAGAALGSCLGDAGGALDSCLNHAGFLLDSMAVSPYGTQSAVHGTQRVLSPAKAITR